MKNQTVTKIKRYLEGQEETLKHLPGRHNQKLHGNRGGTSSSSAPMASGSGVSESAGRYMDIKDIAKEVKTSLKKEFPDCKFSVSIERFSGGQAMRVSLMSAPFEVFGKMNGKYMRRSGAMEPVEYHPFNGDHAQLNDFHLGKGVGKDKNWNNGYLLTPKAISTLRRAIDIANKRNWNNSDIQTDYFDVNYYFSLNIGKWDKPFTVTGKE